MSDGYLMTVSSLIQGERPKTRRIYLVRNGEACDRIAPAWRHKVFRDHGIYRLIDSNQPVKIVNRPSDSFQNDSPLTQVGSVTSQLLGRGMLLKSIEIHSVYSSPALRCIQTASSIIGSMNMKRMPCIHLEPSLIDPLSFYSQDKLPQFLSSEQLCSSGFQIDPEYRPLYTIPKLNDKIFFEKSPEDFIGRLSKISKRIIKSCEEQPSGGVLVVTHAPVIDALYRLFTDTPDRPQSPADLHRMGLNYPFSSVTTLEQNSDSKKWILLPDALPPLTYMHSSTAIQIPVFD